MTTYIAASKEDFKNSFADNYAMRGDSFEKLRLCVSAMTCVRIINPEIQPWPDFDTDDIDEIAQDAYEWCNGTTE